MTTIRELMTTAVVTVRPEMTLTELDEHLVASRVSGAPVVDDGQLVGIVSQTDVVRTLYGEQQAAQQVSAFYDSPFPIPIPALEHLARDTRRIADHMTKTLVRDVMTPAPGRVSPETDAQEAAQLMAREGYHRLPVVEGERLIGIVSAMDLVRVLGERGFGPK